MTRSARHSRFKTRQPRTPRTADLALCRALRLRSAATIRDPPNASSLLNPGARACEGLAHAHHAHWAGGTAVLGMAWLQFGAQAVHVRQDLASQRPAVGLFVRVGA